MAVCNLTIILLTIILLVTVSGLNCATFENVTLLLTSRRSKLFVDGKPPTHTIFIKSNNALEDYVNLQPLEIIKIQNQNVPILAQDSASNLPNVIEIAITSSKIKQIEPGAFRNLPKLDFLNLSNNALEEIKNGVFTDLNLISLFLQNNKLSILGDRVFNNMTMSHLVLENNRLSIWNSGWFSGNPVRSIYLSNNLLEELPANALDYFVKLKKKDLQVSFQYLALNNNNLKRINPEAFNGIADFIYLGLQNNSLEELPPEIFQTVKYINTLELNGNKLNNVDEIFNNMVIQYLRLQNNNLDCFPLEVLNVTKIYHLSMDGNPITCDCIQLFEEWQKEAEERIVYLNSAWKTYLFTHST